MKISAIITLLIAATFLPTRSSAENFCLFTHYSGKAKKYKHLEGIISDAVREFSGWKLHDASTSEQYTADTKARLTALLKQARSILNSPQLKTEAPKLRKVLWQAKNVAVADLGQVTKGDIAFLFKAMTVTELLLKRTALARSFLMGFFKLTQTHEEEEFMFTTEVKQFYKEIAGMSKYKVYRLKLAVKPSGALVSVDYGYPVAAGSSLELYEGQHTLVFTKPGWHRYSFIVDPADYEEMKLTVSMKKLPWSKKFRAWLAELFTFKKLTHKDSFLTKSGCDHALFLKFSTGGAGGGSKKAVNLQGLHISKEGARTTSTALTAGGAILDELKAFMGELLEKAK